MRSFRRVTQRVAAPLAVAASVLLFATCDLDKISGTPKPLDPAAVRLLFSITGDSVVILGGTLNLGVAATEGADLSHTTTQWSATPPGIVSVNQTSGVVTGSALGHATVTVRLLAPELDTGWTQSTDVRVRYKGINVAPIDSVPGLGPTRGRTVVVRGTNNADVPQTPALSTGLTLTVHDSGATTTVNATLAGNTVVGHRNGFVWVVGSFEGMKDSALVKIRQVAKSIIFPTTDYVATAINADVTVPFTARDVADSVITTPSATYQIADPTVATIDATGTLHLLKNDTTRLFVTVDTVTRSQKVVVQQVVSTLAKSLGDDQIAEVATSVSVPPKITALDAGGTPVEGATITFTPGPGSGTVIGGTVITDANGEAAVGGWTLGTVAGPQTLIATIGGASTTFNATALPGLPAELRFTVQPVAVGVSSIMSPAVKVAVTDTLGNVVTGATDQIVLSLATNPAGAILSGTTTQSAVNGVATFSDLALDAASDGYSLQAVASGLADAISNQFAVYGTKTQLAFVTQPSNGIINQPISPAIRVAIQDANGSTVANATDAITLSVAAGPSTTINGAVTVNAVNGVATFSSVAFPSSGAGYQIQASGASLPATTSNAFSIASVGPAVKLGFEVPPVSSVAGTVIQPTTGIRVAIQDANGTTVSTAFATVTLSFQTNAGNGALSGSLSQPTTNGVATFSDISIDKAAIGYKLSATPNGTSLASATSPTFTISAGSAAKLRYVQQPTTIEVGGTIDPAVAVAVADAFDNIVSAAQANITLASNCGGLSGGASTATSSGIATFPAVSFSSVATGCQLQATGGFPSVTSAAFNVVPAGGAVRLAFVATPSNTVAGQNIGGLSVQLQNASGQLVSAAPSVNVTLSLGTNAGNTALAGALTVGTSGGEANFSSVTLPVAATGYTVTASATGYSPVTSNAFNITPDAPTKLGFVAQPSNAVAGANLSPAVRVAIQDAYGNTVPSATDNIQLAFSSNPGGGALGGTVTVTPINGVATFNAVYVQNAGAGYTLQATAPSTVLTGAVSNSFNITTGTAYGFRFVSQPAGASANATLNTVQVQVVDAQGNDVTSESPSVGIALSGGTPGAVLGGTTTQTATNGFATFSDLSVSAAGTNYRLNAGATGLTTRQSNAFDISAGVPTQLTFTSYPSTMVAAPQTGTFVVAIADAGGNTVTSASSINITLSVASGPGTMGGTVTQATVNGVATFNDITLSAPGTFTVTTTNGAGYTEATTGDITVSGEQLTIEAGDGQTGTVGTNVVTNPRVKVSNSSGTGIQGVNVTFTTTGDATLDNSSSTVFTAASDVSGFVEVPWALRTTAGPDTLWAALTSEPAITVRFTATAEPGAAAIIEKVDGDGQSGAINSALPVAPLVRITDSYGNGVGSVSVTFAPTAGSGSVQNSPVLTDLSGYASAGTWTLGPSGGTHTLNASAGVLSTDFTATATGADPCSNVTSYTLGSTANGTLGATSCQEYSEPADKYSITTSAPSTFFSTTVSSSAFLPALVSQLWSPSSAQLISTTGASPVFRFYLVGPATHEIHASSTTENAAGDYALSTVVNATVPSGCFNTLTSRNVTSATQTMSSSCTIAHDTATSISGQVSSVRFYLIWQEAGQQLTIRMNQITSNVDPYLEARVFSGNNTGAFLGYSDDDGGELNSLLVIAAPVTGRFVQVKAMHYVDAGGSPQDGTFSLTIDP